MKNEGFNLGTSLTSHHLEIRPDFYLAIFGTSQWLRSGIVHWFWLVVEPQGFPTLGSTTNWPTTNSRSHGIGGSVAGEEIWRIYALHARKQAFCIKWSVNIICWADFAVLRYVNLQRCNFKKTDFFSHFRVWEVLQPILLDTRQHTTSLEHQFTISTISRLVISFRSDS